MDSVRLLVQRSQKGDTGAFEELVALYQDKVYTLSYQLTGNHADAQDLAQEAFVKAYSSLTGFRNEADFGTWIHRITVNLGINFKRRQKAVVSLDEPVLAGDSEVPRLVAATSETPEEALETQELRSMLWAGLRELSREHRVILVLREMQGFPYEDIARVMNLSLGTVKSRINRARQALRDKMRERNG